MWTRVTRRAFKVFFRYLNLLWGLSSCCEFSISAATLNGSNVHYWHSILIALKNLCLAFSKSSRCSVCSTLFLHPPSGEVSAESPWAHLRRKSYTNTPQEDGYTMRQNVSMTSCLSDQLSIDDTERAVRYVKFNVEAAQEMACKAVGAARCTSFVKLDEGDYLNSV